VLTGCGVAPAFAVEASDAEDEERVNGLVSAVDRRKGLDDADWGAGGGVGAMALV